MLKGQGDTNIAGDTHDTQTEGIHNRADRVLMHGDPVSTIFFELRKLKSIINITHNSEKMVRETTRDKAGRQPI